MAKINNVIRIIAITVLLIISSVIIFFGVMEKYDDETANCTFINSNDCIHKEIINGTCFIIGNTACYYFEPVPNYFEPVPINSIIIIICWAAAIFISIPLICEAK